MFWKKKKEGKEINDPVTQYGRLINENKNKKRNSKKGKILDFLTSQGNDSSFVYYED